MKKFLLTLPILVALFVFAPSSLAVNEQCTAGSGSCPNPPDASVCTPPPILLAGCPSGKVWIGDAATGKCETPSYAPASACPANTDAFLCETNTCYNKPTPGPAAVCSTYNVNTGRSLPCCPDGTFAVRDASAPTGWTCSGADFGGNVGIGTDSPNTLFNVVQQGTGPIASIGRSNIVTGNWANALGTGGEATGEYSLILNHNNTASGSASLAGGYTTTASGTRSTAFGDLNEASGYAAFVVNQNNIASGSRSFAGGVRSTASGSASFVHSDQSTASGSRSVVIGGWKHTNSGLNSVILGGYNNSVTSRDSLTSGQNLNNNSMLNVAIGNYNVGGGSPTSWVTTDPLFEVGNGANSSARNNAFTVYKNGNVDVDNNLTVGGSLTLDGDTINTWSDISLSSPWTESGSDVYRSSGNVGIGTTTPAYPLEINASNDAFRVGTSNSWFSFWTGGNARISLGNGAASEAGFIASKRTSNINYLNLGACDNNGNCPSYLTLKEDGNVGIDTTTPDADLHVNDTIRVGEDPSYGSVYGELYHTGSGNGFRLNAEAGGGSWADMYFQTNGNTRMFIESSGNVGIGTTSPSERLEVNGNIRLEDGGDAYIENANGYIGLRPNDTTHGLILRDYTGASTEWSGIRHVNNGSNDRLEFSVKNSGYGSGLVLTQNNRVGIGTGAPSYKLHVSGNDSDGSVALIDNTSTSSNSDGLIIRIGPNINTDTDNYFIQFQDGNGTGMGGIRGEGSPTVKYQTFSDARLKTNIRNYDGSLEKLLKVRPVIFNFKSNPDFEDVGFIAQELYEVFEYPVAGTPDDDISNPMGIDYGRLTPLLAGAIQELKAEKDAEIAELKAVVCELKPEAEVCL
jgi:hypothetical protein